MRIWWFAGLEELDSVYASPSDFQHLRRTERAKGAALIQTFVKQCNDAEVNHFLLKNPSFAELNACVTTPIKVYVCVLWLS